MRKRKAVELRSWEMLVPGSCGIGELCGGLQDEQRRGSSR